MTIKQNSQQILSRLFISNVYAKTLLISFDIISFDFEMNIRKKRLFSSGKKNEQEVILMISLVPFLSKLE